MNSGLWTCLGVNVLTLAERREFDHRNDKIVALYKSGRTLEAVGAIFGITRERVRQILKKRGVPSRHPVVKARNAKIVDDAKAGLTMRELGARYGLSAATICKILQTNNVKAKRPPHPRKGKSPYLPLYGEIIKTYQSGLSIVNTAAKFDVHWQTIRRILIRNDIPRRKPGGRYGQV